jgi:hypothetical protein
MPAAIDTQVKKQVINQWLAGDSRDRIAADNDIGAGTVSNIINEWKKGVEDSDYDSVRELAVYSRKEGFRLSHIASSIRISNYIKKLGANITAVLMGVVVSMNVYVFRHSKGLKITAASFFSGSTLSVLSSTCASCSSLGSLLASTFGGLGVTASTFLSNYQIPLRIISVALLIWALYSIRNKLTTCYRMKSNE